QLHHDHQLTIDDVVAFQRQDIRMANRFDAAESLQLLLGAVIVVAGAFEIAEHEFDSFEQTPRSLCFPDFSETTSTQALDESVAGNRFCSTFNPHRHGISLSPGTAVAGTPLDSSLSMRPRSFLR